MSLESTPTEIQAKILKMLPVKPLTLIPIYNENHSLVQQEFIPTVPDLIKNIDDTSVVGSSHGLLCFNKRKSGISGALTDTVVLWNPSIRKSVGIQVPNMYDSLNDICHSFWEDNIIGFGVCPVTFDPTILKIECIDYKRKLKDVPGISLTWKVRVFTLSTGTWSILSTNLPRDSITLRWSHVVIDRFIYWDAFEIGASQSHFLIMSFDLTAKEFKQISLPDSLTNPLCSIKSISKLHESLVLFEYHREIEEDVSVCCLWMMKEQGVSRSFTKLYNINVPHATVKTLLGFRKTGELILETQKQIQRCFAELEVYDPKTEAIDNLGIDGDEYSFFMCSYMESFLMIDHLDGFTYSISN
uniref:uncharacterized protein LOC122604177 n=1 Tax=Erigeron canadensis TaxID=72917 RepID=UPI001CB94E8D|nr:uncharacterized protein LOC122604177 [Erigeron canadensis]